MTDLETIECWQTCRLMGAVVRALHDLIGGMRRSPVLHVCLSTVAALLVLDARVDVTLKLQYCHSTNKEAASLDSAQVCT